MDFLTEEEEFELLHGDEMEALHDMEYQNFEIPDFSSKSFKSSNSVESSKATLDSLGIRSSSQEVECTEIENHVPQITVASESNCSDLLCNNSVNENSVNHLEKDVFSPPSRSKRSISEVFGDSEESLYSDISNKKHCVLPDYQRETPMNNFVSSNKFSHARKSLSYESSRSFMTEQQPITRSDGQRRYFTVHDEDETDIIPSFSQKTSSLLTMPINLLKSQLHILREVQLSQRVERDSTMTSSVQDESTPDIYEEQSIEHSLWVEKYRPLSYMHLLSEEGINRTLLQWLKLWDKVVFGREKKAHKKKVPPAVPPGKFQKAFGELVDEPDEHGRPFHKVAFLCGPPGLGKTTLAIIIAKHVGYNVVELNASDDRSPEAFRTSLEAATQMKSVLHEDHRPNCLILDEIDGAPAPSINVLLQFIKSTGIPKGKRKKGDIPLLTRPIICICNDQYSIALKPLRQLALLLNFPATAASRLTSRLNEVAVKEGLRVDMAALTLLCEKASNDIRSCLSTLQFIHRQKKELKLSDVSGLKIGQKDMQKSLFAVWQDIFHHSKSKSFAEISGTVQAFGDYERIFVGMFENYVNVKFKGRNLETLWKGPEWMCFGDIIQQQIAHHQLYILMPYLPYPAVAFHFLYASTAYYRVSYPSAFYESKSKATQLSNILVTVVKEIASSLKTFLNPCVVIEDILPFLSEIIKPTLRPVNTQLYSEREKSELHRVIELMLSFNFNYRQERQQNGTYEYVLDPNIEELIRFSEIKPKRMLNYAAKQLIAREVEVERMRKGDASEQLKTKADEKVVAKPIEKVIQKPEKIKTTTSERPTLDFFGRKIILPPKDNLKDKDPRDEEVWFRFKEGYSNAVRRTLYIKDLM